MDVFEDLAPRTKQVPSVWKRFVEDTFCMIEETNVRTFLDHFNSLLPIMQFTMEMEKDGSLPFLGTLLTWTDNGSIDIEVYCKTTHTD